MGPKTIETIILESGAGILMLGLALITGGVVGALLARRKSGAVFPLSLVLAAVALLLWWEPLARVVVSFALLLIGYTWLIAWWRASQQERDWLPSHRLLSNHSDAAPPGGSTWRGTPGVQVAWATQPARSLEVAVMRDETRAG